MMCAFEAARRGRRVLLLEHADRPGKKILISGGGRCNFTNLHTRPENFLSANPHFAKSALARFTPADMLALIHKHHVPYHEKTLGQLFCDDTAQRIVNLLRRECDEAGVELRLDVRVSVVQSTPGQPTRFAVETSAQTFSTNNVVVATGGLSIPKLGATGNGYDIARHFGHTILEPRPALVPLVFSATDHQQWSDLTGLSAEAIASIPTAPSAKKRAAHTPHFREKVLITHRGLSGPAVLQISSYWNPNSALHFDLAPGREVFAPLLAANARRRPAALLHQLRQSLPARFAERWLTLNAPPDFTNLSLRKLEDALHAWRITPAGTEGFAKAEVTAGGLDTRELDARTLQSLRAPGLYFIGEVVDVTGWLGGYNFQWAWASAVAAGRSL